MIHGNKKLLALAVASVLAGSTAQARGIISVAAENDPVKLLAALKANIESFTDKQLKRVQGLEDRLVEAEQKLVGHALPSLYASTINGGASLTSKIVNASGFQDFAARRVKNAGFNVTSAELLNVSANTIVNDPDNERAQRDYAKGIYAAPGRRAWLRELLPSIPGAGPAVEFLRESGFTNNAASQGDGNSPMSTEGVLKAESDIELELKNARYPTIAHFVRASRQVLDDQPALRQFLDSRLRYGLNLELERQIIAGAGTGGDMTGFTAAGNHTPYAPETGDTALDTISAAKAELEVANFAPSFVAMHPRDFSRIERLKGSDDHYVIGTVPGTLQPTLWGIPVFRSATVTENEFVMADAMACALSSCAH